MGKCASSLILGLFVLGVTPTAHAQATPGQCGYDRWPVKILTDKDHKRVNFHPLDTTVAKLASIPIHEIPYPEDQRIDRRSSAVIESSARLMTVRKEQDLHLLIADPDHPEVQMIAEISAPTCTSGTGHEEEYRRARSLALSLRRGEEINRALSRLLDAFQGWQTEALLAKSHIRYERHTRFMV